MKVKLEYENNPKKEPSVWEGVGTHILPRVVLPSAMRTASLNAIFSKVGHFFIMTKNYCNVKKHCYLSKLTNIRGDLVYYG